MNDGNQRLRISVPPYCVFTELDGLPLLSLPGNHYGLMARYFAPSALMCRVTLVKLRGRLRWSRAMLAAFLGTSEATLRRWETGQRRPSGAARRLIWLVDMLVNRPKTLESGLDFMQWGRQEEILKFSRELHESEAHGSSSTAYS